MVLAVYRMPIRGYMTLFILHCWLFTDWCCQANNWLTFVCVYAYSNYLQWWMCPYSFVCCLYSKPWHVPKVFGIHSTHKCWPANREIFCSILYSRLKWIFALWCKERERRMKMIPKDTPSFYVSLISKKKRERQSSRIFHPKNSVLKMLRY